MDRPARCVFYAPCGWTALRWRKVRSAYSYEICGEKGVGKIAEPMGFRPGIVVNVRYYFAACSRKPCISSSAEADMWGANRPKTIFRGDIGARVGRAVIHNDHFEVGII